MTEVDEWLDGMSGELAELTSRLISFDTQSVDGSGRSNQEGECQTFLRSWLVDAGCDFVVSVRPEPADFADEPMMPGDLTWDGREMTLAKFSGSGQGRSLIINGHIDVVSPGSADEWVRDPFGGEIADGAVHGRGAADMKGGLAAACVALKALRQADAPVGGDVWLQCVTDEETNGMGTVAMLRHAPSADAAICPEPTGLDAWTSCRGVLYGRVTIHGRGGHAEGHQHDWRAGGGVSAVEKLRPVLDAIERINADWQQRSDKAHPVLARPRIVPTVVRGGDFVATFPAVCDLEVDVTYLPADADAGGFGERVRAEIEHEVAAVVRNDPWLSENPPEWEWFADYPPYEPTDVEALCSVLEGAAATLGHRMRRRGLNSWHDAASIGARAGIPAVSFGPGDPRLAHKPNEQIAIEDLVVGAKAIARVILDWCKPEPEVVR